MLWTVYEEESDDESHYSGPPPGNLDSFYNLSASIHQSLEAEESQPPPVPPIPQSNPGPSVDEIETENKNLKKESSEKHVEEVEVHEGDEEEEAERGHNRDTTVEEPIWFPDGGLRAWLVVLGTFCTGIISDQCMLLSFGYASAWGVFQTYYEGTVLKQHSSSTMFDTVCLGPSPGTLVRTTFRLWDIQAPVPRGSVLIVVSTILVGQCNHFWHFLLCQGVALGLGCGIVFAPGIGIIGQWFRKRRGLALGITALGSSAGGIVVPIATRRLIPVVGFPWTMRILGFILLFVLIVSNLTLTRRLPLRNASGRWLNIGIFQELPFSLYAIAVLSGFLGLYSVSSYIELDALAVGVSPDMAFYLVSVANASSAFGRIAAGALADQIGAINVIFLATLFTAALNFAWPFAKSESSLIIVAVLYGFMYGAFLTGFILPVYQLSEIGNIGRRIGVIMTIGAAGALGGLPVSGAINQATGGFEFVGIFAGSVLTISAAFMLATQQVLVRRNGCGEEFVFH
ncbi:hypothetical protein D9757_009889 [Collybiopsis confluens]|uniref:Major facilitator superfamily (MFS) profile domain-containing protein n=1 Tax=Collybiopsis confluens TaxID=2823264 RepID=A0A8H5LVL4_9AGAR|nr:hypothetical protein D9757_009889 [Collybiopsis confluens]